MRPETSQLPCKELIGTSTAFVEEINKIPVIARCNSSVMISGETGTGKELCARSIHSLSHRANGPFVPVNCGAIPVELAENEFFGHQRGAFTGAALSRPGLIAEAEGGTLFLDEVDSLPLLLQVKLLRFLQEKTYRPLGCSKECRADVRFIAATGIDLEEAVRSSRLRRDLYYRLNVLTIKLPPLRERREDIPLLSEHLLKKHMVEMDKEVKGFSPASLQKLVFYDWPGNVRELEHVIERAAVLTRENVIQACDIDLPEMAEHSKLSFKEAKEQSIMQFEKTYIKKLLIIHGGNISRAARAAQKHRRAFWELIRKYDIDASSLKNASHM